MKKLNKSHKSGLTWFIFVLFSLLFQELILRKFLGYGGNYIFLFIGIFPLLIMGILFASAGPWRRMIADIYFIGITILFISQLLYYGFFGNLFSFHMLKGTGQIWDFGSEIIKNFLSNIEPVFLLCLPALFYFLIFRKKLSEFTSEKKFGIGLGALSIVLFLSLHLAMGNLLAQKGRAHDLYFYVNPLVETTREYGLISALSIDLRHKIFGEPLIKSHSKEDLFLGESSEVDLPDKEDVFFPESVPYKEESSKEDPVEQIVELPRPQVLALDFAQLEEERNSETLALMDEHYSLVEPTYTNDYTGIFEDYNLIFITAESFWWPVVDKERTPTLYKMVNEGVHLENFYNPIWTVSTYDGEYAGLTGLLPKDGIWSLYAAAFNSSPQSLGWRMKAQGYDCYAYHNHTYTYYDRHESHPNLGYDYKGLGSGVEVEIQWPESDLEMMEITMDEYLDKEPFHVYYLTVSGHSGYSYSGNAMAYKNKAYVEDLPLSEEAASFLGANMELEHALTYLIDKLEEKKIADKTLIVLNPDHVPYALSEGAVEELAGNFSREIERYRSHGIIYAPGMEKVNIEKPVSSLDLLPTVYNLLGLDYDSRLITGKDVFSEKGLVIFYNRSWISEKGYYDSRSESFEPVVGENIPENYVENMNQKVREEFYFSGLLLQEDYFAHLPEKAFLP